MMARCVLFALFAILMLAAAPIVALAGVPDPDPNALPEPTTMLVWLGLASAGGLFFWRRTRESE